MENQVLNADFSAFGHQLCDVLLSFSRYCKILNIHKPLTPQDVNSESSSIKTMMRCG